MNADRESIERGKHLWSMIEGTDPMNHAAMAFTGPEVRAIFAYASRLASPPAGDGGEPIPLEPTREMIDAGAQRLVRWEGDNLTWPGSWDLLEVMAARNEAERVWRSMWCVANGVEP